MPHQCTACGHTFEDGSKEMLSGCPNCGGTTFQFRPSGTSVSENSMTSPPSEAPPDRESGGVAERMGRTATAMRDWMHRDDASPGSSRTDDPPVRRPEETEATPGHTDSDFDDSPHEDGDTATDPTTDPTTDPAIDSTNVETSGEVDESLPETDSEPADDERTTEEVPSTAWPDPPDVSHVRAGKTKRRESTSRSTAEATDTTEADETSGTAEDDFIVAEEEPIGEVTEDTAQASARSEMARPDELPSREEGDAPTSGRVVSEPSGEKPDMAELRAELNEQFESIKIVEPGQYELNLMELYDREEYIIALQENGRYVIQMPEDWLGDRTD